MRRSSAAFVVALALTAAACGSDEGSFPPFAATSPIEELLGVPIDPAEAAAWDEALSQVAIANCMADQGIEYVPDPSLFALRTQGVVPGGGGIDPEVAEIDDARSMLTLMTSEYRVAQLPEEERAAARSLFDPNAAADRTPEERDAFWSALSGTPETGPGCLQQSEGAALADPNRDGGLIAQFQLAVQDAYDRDGDVAAGFESWTGCMAAAGHEYASPGQAQQALRGQATSTARLTDEEIKAGDSGSLAVQERIIADLELIAGIETEVAAASEACAADWFAARAAVRARVADDFVTRFG